MRQVPYRQQYNQDHDDRNCTTNVVIALPNVHGTTYSDAQLVVCSNLAKITHVKGESGPSVHHRTIVERPHRRVL